MNLYTPPVTETPPSPIVYFDIMHRIEIPLDDVLSELITYCNERETALGSSLRVEDITNEVHLIAAIRDVASATGNTVPYILAELELTYNHDEESLTFDVSF